MTHAPEPTDDRPLDELPQPYRAAVEAILAEPIPEIDLEPLIRSRLSLRRRSAGRAISLSSFGAKLMTPRNLAAIAAAVAVIVLLSQWIPSSSNGNFALAQVQEQIEKVKSVQYTVVLNPKDSRQVTTHVMTLGDLQGRKESTAKVGDQRHWIIINDAIRGKMLVIFPEKKAYQLLTIFTPKSGDGKLETGEKTLNFKTIFDELLRAPADSVKRLPEQTIDGKTVVGFVTEKEEKAGRLVATSRRTYWIDPKAKLPIRIEATWRSKNPEIKDDDGIISDFVFDAPLDPALFSTDPPKGFTNLSPQEVAPPDKLPAGHTVPTGHFEPTPQASPPSNSGK
jgi:outer membrane lipoprotein-sorting protein